MRPAGEPDEREFERGAAGRAEDAAARERAEAAVQLLAREGLRAEVTCAGLEGEIAAVCADPAIRSRLARLAPAIRSLGFRYVALEPLRQTEDDEDS